MLILGPIAQAPAMIRGLGVPAPGPNLRAPTIQNRGARVRLRVSSLDLNS